MAENQYGFPTEVLSLPSNGLIYSEDSPLRSGTIDVKYMTAKEEDILTICLFMLHQFHHASNILKY